MPCPQLPAPALYREQDRGTRHRQKRADWSQQPPPAALPPPAISSGAGQQTLGGPHAMAQTATLRVDVLSGEHQGRTGFCQRLKPAAAEQAWTSLLWSQATAAHGPS